MDPFEVLDIRNRDGSFQAGPYQIKSGFWNDPKPARDYGAFTYASPDSSRLSGKIHQNKFDFR